MARSYVALLTLTLLLAGCAGLESRRDGRAPVGGPGEAVEIKALKLTGRLAVKQGKEGHSGGLQWLHASPNHEITVYTPIGTTVAKIEQNAQGAKLTTSDKEVYQAKDADQLMERIFLAYRSPWPPFTVFASRARSRWDSPKFRSACKSVPDRLARVSGSCVRLAR